MNYLKKHYRMYLAEVFLAVAVTCLAIAIPATSKVYATEEYWTVNAGSKVLAVVTSESQAKSIIDKVKNYYVQEGATNVAVKVDPELTVVHKTVNAGQTPDNVKSVDDAVNYIISGGKSKVEYTVQEGDTFWSIAEAKGISLDELYSVNNANENTLIKPGTVIYLNSTKPYVNVQTTQTVVVSREIPFETQYQDDSTIYKGEESVVTEGVPGVEKVTQSQTTTNGQDLQTTDLSKEVEKAPVAKVIKRGTKEKVVEVAATSSSYSSSSSSRSYVPAGNYGTTGSAIANFASQFVGNPYVYGGTSLTNGADCSGFVMSVFRNFGISLPRGSIGQSGVGYSVSLSEAQPGDIVISNGGGHSAIYIGGGRVVEALNERAGIITSSVGYAGPLYDIRRVVS